MQNDEKTPWQKLAMRILKVELTKKECSYQHLSEALAKIGVEKTAANLNKTINLGKFGFDFFLQCAEALGIKEIHIE